MDETKECCEGGDWVMYRPDIKVLDCTVRDGIVLSHSDDVISPRRALIKSLPNVSEAVLRSRFASESPPAPFISQSYLVLLIRSIGKVAFQNWSSEKEEYSGRFSPTVFDSISIATVHALSNGIDCASLLNLQKHKELLLEELYIKYTTNRTTNKEHIIGRIDLASKHFYGISYE